MLGVGKGCSGDTAQGGGVLMAPSQIGGLPARCAEKPV